jgi:hypothetical protein
MNAGDLTQKWGNKTLTADDIYNYLLSNISAASYHNFGTVLHVADLCHQIYLWSTGQEEYLDEFLESIVKNDLFEAAHRADDKNRTALWLYVAVLYNIAPGGWRKRETE